MSAMERRLAYHEAPWLFDAVTVLSRKSRLPRVPHLHLVESYQANAAAWAGNGPGRIYLTRGLLETLDHRGLLSVLAHEIAHLSNGDHRIQRTLRLIWFLVGNASLYFISQGFMLALFGYPGTGSTLLGLLLFLGSLALPQLSAQIMRSREFKADETAARLTGDPLGLAGALRTLDRGHGFFPFPWLQRRRQETLDTHPPVEDRIERLASMARHWQRGLEWVS